MRVSTAATTIRAATVLFSLLTSHKHSLLEAHVASHAHVHACYGRGSDRFGLFLKYDRGAERVPEYAAKFNASDRFRYCGANARGYAKHPIVLIFSPTAGAEDDLTCDACLARESHGGPIWRAGRPELAGRVQRGLWLPRVPASVKTPATPSARSPRIATPPSAACWVQSPT